MSKEEGVGLVLYLGEERDPSWMSSKCHFSRERVNPKGGRTFRVLARVRVLRVECREGGNTFLPTQSLS
jgi:hypothetical protein